MKVISSRFYYAYQRQINLKAPTSANLTQHAPFKLRYLSKCSATLTKKKQRKHRDPFLLLYTTSRSPELKHPANNAAEPDSGKKTVTKHENNF